MAYTQHGVMAVPQWEVRNAGSFATVHVVLPPGAAVDCESDAVVTLSGKVTVKGRMGGGLFSSLARAALAGESFFTTAVQNEGAGPGDVMLAASEPGAISLHRLQGGGDDILLVKGAYVASDQSVTVTTEMQPTRGQNLFAGAANSLMSGTGLFVLRASGHGVVACSAYGSVHAFTLAPGETRAVDNGHIVAWTSGLRYNIGMASRGIFDSVASGEGLMCFFEGPGTVFIQSHKPDESPSGTDGSRPRRGGGGGLNPVVGLLFLVCFGCFFLIVLTTVVGAAFGGGGAPDSARLSGNTYNRGGRYTRP
eukprot:TRINITY_DN22449_c0_g1_i1.p1 TRINITY_DN22449_c0_g1~~TRINITY_DN22449_c0_g1_i1.p1  ORF type:complete len:308 (+),score=59.14 TRINITY_DN22449_c0_g1_i1:48-971(+)